MAALLEMLDKAKVPYINHTSGEIVANWKKYAPETDHVIEIQNSPDLGYLKCLSIWLFDVNGNLLKVGHFAE